MRRTPPPSEALLMDALDSNNRSFASATIMMIVVAAALITVGILAFPLTAYDDPRAGTFGSLINTRAGNIVIFALFGALAVNMAVFLARVTSLEQERNALLARTAEPPPPATPISGKKNPVLPSPNN